MRGWRRSMQAVGSDGRLRTNYGRVCMGYDASSHVASDGPVIRSVEKRYWIDSIESKVLHSDGKFGETPLALCREGECSHVTSDDPFACCRK